mgnify:CR=1 FL=1|jgi:hypothetical protein
MKKIGITTTIYGNNFGEALQAFAMKNAINTYCKNTVAGFVNFICFNQVNINKPGFERYLKLNEHKNNLFNEFREEELGIIGRPQKHIETDDNLNFDKYVFGSDQIWNTNAWKIPEFFGSFVTSMKPKIAYAASVGLQPNSELLNKELFEKYIDTFDYLSVREKIHCDFIKQFTNKPVEFVADPTMLLDVSCYVNLFKDIKIERPNNKYIFYYQPHSADGAILNLVNKIARKNKMDVVHTFAEIPKIIFPYESISARFAGPKEFLKYIANADLVITRSYHAVVFSILFKKPFYAYVDKKTGSRFESLLSTLGLEDRLVYDYLDPQDVNFDIDYRNVYEKLDQFKSHSIKFLKKALEN